MKVISSTAPWWSQAEAQELGKSAAKDTDEMYKGASAAAGTL
ncbi:hypothetical protein [Salinarimonas soli]|nr:hypothetical protein [Salinarimonas soli]